MARLKKGKIAGRKRKADCLRHPSGRLRQAGARERAERAIEQARKARERIFGLSPRDAAKPEAGSALGRLLIAREITSAQYEAALRYEEISRAAHRALLARKLVSAGDLDALGRGFSGGEGEDENYIAACRAAIARVERCHAALAATGDPIVRSAVDRIVLEDEELARAVGELRLGLNALCRLFKIPQNPPARGDLSL